MNKQNKNKQYQDQFAKADTDSYDSEERSEQEAIIYEKAPKSVEQEWTDEDSVLSVRKKSSKAVSFSKMSRSNLEELMLKRQNLELKLANSQLEEAVKMDEHKAIQARLERVENLLQAFLNYLDCFTMESKSSSRLCQQINEFIVHDASEAMNEEVSQIIKASSDNQIPRDIATIKNKISQTLQEGKKIGELVIDYHNRSKDYFLASQNFKILLENANLNLKQINHLQKQYEGILVSLQHSRCILDQEMPNLISSYMAVLVTAFECVGKDADVKNESRYGVLKLLQNLASTLEESGMVILKRNFKEIRGCETRCASCRCNCMNEDK